MATTSVFERRGQAASVCLAALCGSEWRVITKHRERHVHRSIDDATPTLVLHSRRDARIPFEQGLMLAHGIPNARFVALESDNHLILSHELAWPRYLDEICNFLNESRQAQLRLAATSGKRTRNSIRR